VVERQFGPYRLIRQIAVGGMAEIHLAKTAGIAGFEKYVALKMIHPNFAEDDDFIQMLVDEAKIAVQLTHGNIAQTFDLGRVGDTYYITMEYVDGADLYKILRRASERDLEMPLDVCAFVGKEISSALDHAHRKRDHTGKPLGIVHRDVSPQNVLVSYSGEVKLVDFGIAKATMKVRQTAVGVIKGKYYYMSPEQAWGDPIDHRSDIFSAGIVLYEMITGQMLYLEEDLHKLLEMARSADIAPPSKLRRGVPPQLERIVMHALAKRPDERYQSAADFASDLERFLHTYSPVFTASKLSSLLRAVVGDPLQVPDEAPFQSIEFRDGVMSTHPLSDAEVAHAIDRDELRDENSVIFQVSDLENGKASTLSPSQPSRRPGTRPLPGTPPLPITPKPAAPNKPLPKMAPRVTRATDPMPEPSPRPSQSPLGPSSLGKIPSIDATGEDPRPAGRPVGVPTPRDRASPIDPVARAAAPVGPPRLNDPASPASRPSASAGVPQVKPRQINEDTRRLEAAAPANPLHDDSSGAITLDGAKPAPEAGGAGNRPGTLEEDLENIGEHTLVTGAPGMPGFMMDMAGDDGDSHVEATLVTAPPTPEGFTEDSTGEPADTASAVPRDFAVDHPTKPARPKTKAAPPAALAAKIHAPAVSELRKPRPSRRTPSGGVPIQQPSVLQAIVSSQVSEPMPAPRPAPALPPPPAPPMPAMTAHAPSAPTDPIAPQFPVGTPGAQPSYTHDVSGLPLGTPTPPGMSAQPSMPVPVQGAPPGYDYPQMAAQMSPQGYPQLTPGALYPFHPQPPPPHGMSLTGQLRLSEVDELPSQYKLGSGRQQWFTYIASGVLAVSVAASVTFLIIRSTRESTPALGSIHIESVPPGADVIFDKNRLTDKTPLTIDGAPAGTRHTIRLELRHYEPREETVDIAKTGGRISVPIVLKQILGKIVVDSVPANAEIRIDGQLRGRTPMTVTDLDMNNARRLELRLKGYQPYIRDLTWPADGKIPIKAQLEPSKLDH
jgi:serine/threonine protein kinase